MGTRREFLRCLCAMGAGAALTSPWTRAMAQTPANDEFFLLIHAAGGWDVTLWSDPRAQSVGIIDPANTAVMDFASVRKWQSCAADADGMVSFVPVQPPGSNIVFGPAIGDLAGFYDRLTVINGISMNTVAHPDGTYFSTTGRHLAGGKPAASSLDTMLANEFGTGQLFPAISVTYPTAFVGADLDPQAQPVRVDAIGSIASSLTRVTSYDSMADLDGVSAMLTDEANDLAKRSFNPSVWKSFAAQYGSLRNMLKQDLKNTFKESALRTAYPLFFARPTRFQTSRLVNAAFAVDAFKGNLVRAIGFATNSVDTHAANYKDHGTSLQEIFDMLAVTLQYLDQTPHPTLAGEKLADHTHIMVVSDFCRTPQINATLGRDHYPNNSTLIISPRFKGNLTFGKADDEQLLPTSLNVFAGPPRAIEPPDVMATFFSAFGGSPRKYMRDGDVVKELLK